VAQSTYLYRCTEQQLEEHLQRVADAGDAVEHVIFKGGRDYVLVCRKAGDDPVAAVLVEILAEIRGLRENEERRRRAAARAEL
jgi:hypothetical protein